MDELVKIGELLNISAIMPRTHSLGPGIRNAVWFQGCPFHCKGCISPDWIEDKNAFLISPEVIADYLAGDESINGITISGGEPFFQPLGLNKFLRRFQSLRPDLTVILFTGFLLEKIEQFPIDKKATETLSFIDLLIDGLYLENLNNNLGLRGSSNQRIHRLSGRFDEMNFEEMNRINEVFLRNGEFQISGVPDKTLGQFVQGDLKRMKVTSYVRS